MLYQVGVHVFRVATLTPFTSLAAQTASFLLYWGGIFPRPNVKGKKWSGQRN